MSHKNANEPVHDNLRDLIGQAISNEIAAGAEQPDWCDSREIDRLADAVMAVLRKEAPAPRLDLNIVIDDTLPANTAVLEAGGQSVTLVGLGGTPAPSIDSPEFRQSLDWMLGMGYRVDDEAAQPNIRGLVRTIDEWQRAVTAQAVVAERERPLPDLTCVIHWLENGCDPLNAAKELRAYQKQMGLPDVAELPARQRAQAAQPKCKTCDGKGIVDDGEIDHYPNGEPYMHGPVKCVKDCPDCSVTEIAQSALSEEQRHLLHTVIDCCEILNKRPCPMCRDCADEEGTCPHGGLQCDMDKLFADARAILATRQPAPVDRAAIDRKVLERGMDGPDVVGPTVCTVPPPGWACTRAPGHDGPCAAIPTAPVAADVAQGEADDPMGYIDPDYVFSLADAHADETLESGQRVLDRGGILQLVIDAIRHYAPAAQPPADAAPDGHNVRNAAKLVLARYDEMKGARDDAPEFAILRDALKMTAKESDARYSQGYDDGWKEGQQHLKDQGDEAPVDAKRHSDVVDFLIDCVARSLDPDAMATECLKFFAAQPSTAQGDAPNEAGIPASGDVLSESAKVDHMFDEYDVTEEELEEAFEYGDRLRISEQHAMEDAKKHGVAYINLMTGRWIPHGLMRVVNADGEMMITHQRTASQPDGERDAMLKIIMDLVEELGRAEDAVHHEFGIGPKEDSDELTAGKLFLSGISTSKGGERDAALTDALVDKAIEAFHEIKPLAGNDPIDWPEAFISTTRTAMRAAMAAQQAEKGGVA